MTTQSHSIILGGGCFWCIEAAFQLLQGITHVESGYAGGDTDSPNYQSVCSGNSGHAEVVKVTWDPEQTTLNKILDCFFTIHDPTTLNQQGNDIGSQYRSFIGYFDEDQKLLCENYIAQLNQQLDSPATTELQLAPVFFKAEEEHQNYYQDNSQQPYCQVVIRPKLAKLQDHKNR